MLGCVPYMDVACCIVVKIFWELLEGDSRHVFHVRGAEFCNSGMEHEDLESCQLFDTLVNETEAFDVQCAFFAYNAAYLCACRVVKHF